VVKQAAKNAGKSAAKSAPSRRASATSLPERIFLDLGARVGSRSEATAALDALSRSELERLLGSWGFQALEAQQPPSPRLDGEDWTTWLVLGGRGAGKTRAGAAFIKGMALGEPDFTAKAVGRLALVGETFADAREVMVEGPSGVLSLHPSGERPLWSPSRRRLEWSNGAVALVFSAEDPESLRGPQFAAAWADEIGKWRQDEEVWDMLQFGLRLGAPRQVATTTPRTTPLIRRLLADPRTRVSRPRTRDNRHLAPGFLAAVEARYAGTRLGRQELDGELIEERPGALWRRDLIDGCRVAAAPALARVVVAVDPPATSGPRADACGIVAAGLDKGGTAYVLADATLEHAAPHVWAAGALALYRRLEADALVVEVNQGGEMVTSVLRGVDPGVPVTSVRATRGKYLRAEPVAALYGQGRVHHVGAFPQLEDEMCDYAPGQAYSPDRLDALVWALTHLLVDRVEPRIRVL
jgi:phage terminase large subunit-like protein